MIQLTAEQKQVHDAAVAFAREKRDGYLTIGGLAGTGKTTVTASFVKTLRRCMDGLKIAFVCYTGKAASVLRQKLTAAQALANGEYVGTIHGLMYKAVTEDGVIVGWRRVEQIDADLIVIDEASMVNEIIWDDLRTYGKPIIAVGDHGQLPPIKGAFSLMTAPHHALTTIHRQAEGNPIIRLSMLARETGEIPGGAHGDGVFKMPNSATLAAVVAVQKDLRDTLFLCGRNQTRQAVNAAVRARLGYEGAPKAGEKVICLKNNREAMIYNGLTGTLKKYDAKRYADGTAKQKADILVDMEDGVTFAGDAVTAQFGAERTLREHESLEPRQLRELFDWGYCLTVHKAQGSEAESVVLFEERFSHMDDAMWRKWLYTAVTRARKRLLIVNRRYEPRPVSA